MAKRYARLNWNSTTTYVSAENLNIMDKGVDDCDNAIEVLSGKVGTVGNTDLQTQINNVNNNLSDLFQRRPDPNTKDANVLADAGLYIVGADYLNVPATYGILLQFDKLNGTYNMQVYKSVVSSDNNLYIRTKTETEWGVWKYATLSV